MSSQKSDGFILIELLFVIVILGILMVVTAHNYEQWYRTRSESMKLSSVLSSPFIVDDMEQTLEFGSVVIASPPSMELNDVERVYLLLDLKKKIQELFVLLPEGHEKHGSKVKVSNRMQASLQSHKFDVKQETHEIQAVGTRNTVRWIWSLKPKEEGVHTLTIVLSALIPIQGQPTPIVLDTYTKEITVLVPVPLNIWKFLKENMSWLWAPISAIGIGILYLARFIWAIRKKQQRTD